MPTIITVGCKTDHGGVVITGDPLAMINGKPIARLGDLVSCPQIYPWLTPHGTNKIVAGPCTNRANINGRLCALSSDLTECGSILLPCNQLGECGC